MVDKTTEELENMSEEYEELFKSEPEHIETELCDVVLSNVGYEEVDLIRMLRKLTGKNLEEIKSIISSLPVAICKNISTNEAEKIKNQLSAIGASVKIISIKKPLSNNTNGVSKQAVATANTMNNKDGFLSKIKKILKPVFIAMLETDTVNIAPLTSEDATNIANAINDGNYTTGNIDYVSNEPTTAPAKEIRVFTNATFEPFEYYSGSNMVGFDIDLINALCDKLGYEAIIEDVEFDAVMNGIAEAKAGCGIAGITVTEERKMSVDFSDIYISCYVDYGDGQGKVEQDFAIAFPKGSSLIGEFNSAIELAKTDGTIDALVEKWNVNTVD